MVKKQENIDEMSAVAGGAVEGRAGAYRATPSPDTGAG